MRMSLKHHAARSIQPTARETALRILCRLELEDLYSDRALTETLSTSRLSLPDRALVTELVNGVLRWRRRLDWALEQLLIRRKIADLTPWIRNILRMGLYQIELLDRIPPPAATDQAVTLAKRYGHRGTASLVNAVLRKAALLRGQEVLFPQLSEDPIAHIGLRYSHPDWMVRRWRERYGQEETLALCQANNRVPSPMVRVNTLKVTDLQVKEQLHREGISFNEGRWVDGFLQLHGGGDLTRLDAFRQGWFQIQDESAGIAVKVLDPRPGEIVLDLCSAPGGKSTHLAAVMANQGRVVAMDLYPRRLQELVDNCRRLGVVNVLPVVADGRRPGILRSDRALVDAPCSGLGALSRRADLRWKKREEDIPRLAVLQRELLRAAADVIRPGGILVYSTCTLEDEENEEVVRLLLAERRDLVVESAAAFAHRELVTPQGFVRTFPHRHGVDGTFSARLRKRAVGESS